MDWQKRLVPVMPPEMHATHVANAERLLRGAKVFGLPVIVTEHCPSALGRTVEPLAEAARSAGATFVEKEDFSAWAVPAMREAVAAAGPRAWLVAGMETHVCVFQTVRDMAEAGLPVWLVRDAVVSRVPANWEVGVGLCAAAGARIGSLELVLFDLCGRAEGDRFKALIRLVR